MSSSDYPLLEPFHSDEIESTSTVNTEKRKSFKLGDRSKSLMSLQKGFSLSNYSKKMNVHKPKMKKGSNQFLDKMNALAPVDDGDDIDSDHYMAMFGQPLDKLKSIKLPSYTAQIPLLLIELKKLLHSVDGLTHRKIFHFSVKNKSCSHHKIAHLIRDFFDNLPTKLLDDVPVALFRHDIGNAIERISDPQKSVFLWLLDLMADTVEHSEQNRMSVHVLAKSMAPNMISNKANIGLVISFIKTSIEWRLSSRQ